MVTTNFIMKKNKEECIMKRYLILMLLLGLLLTGCRKQTQPEQLPTAETIDTQANTEPAAQTPEQTLTLGMIDFDSEKSVLRSMIQSYNFSGAPFRIEILNYADGAESRADAVTRMTTELLAGNVPELLDCSDLSGAQYAGYAKNGILLPLDGMPDAELLSGILKPCYVDGKLYSIVGAFALDPLFGPARRWKRRSRTCCAAQFRTLAFSGAVRICSASTAAMRRSSIWTMIHRPPPSRARNF